MYSVWVLVLLAFPPFTRARALSFGPGEPFLLSLQPPLWADRKLRKEVLQNLREEFGVEVVHPLPRFRYVAVVRGEKKGEGRRRMLQNVTYSPRVGKRLSSPLT